MRANVGAQTSDRWRYVERARIGKALRGVTLAEEPLDLLADYAARRAATTRRSTTTAPLRAARAQGALRALAGHDLEALAVERRARTARARASCFHSSDGDEVFVDRPRAARARGRRVGALEAGLAQRVRALNAFVADVYGDAADRRARASCRRA